MPGEPLGRPGQRPGRRLVPGGEQRDELVAQLVLAGAGGDQVSEHGVARRRRADRLAQQRVDAPRRGHERPPRRGAARRQRERDQARHRRGHVERRADALAQGRIGSAEHDPQDDVEGEGLEAGQRAERPAGRPAGELRVGERGDRRPVRFHALAVERRQHELALAHVGRTVEQEDRARAGERLDDGRARAALQLLGRRGVDAPDRVGVREHDHRGVGPQRAQRERLAVARRAAPQQVGRPRDPLDRLERGWCVRSRWQRRRHGTGLSLGL